MEADMIEDLFDASGYDFLYRKFHYQMYVTGLFDRVSDPALLESFLSCYSFENGQPLIFDEFAFHFRIFEHLYHANDLGSKDGFYYS